MTLSQEELEDILLKLVQDIPDVKSWLEINDIQGWRKGSDGGVCYWEGILCDYAFEKFVEGIFLPAKSITATLPTELGQLNSLRELSLPQNYLRGTIPTEIASLPHLQIVNLSQNQLSGILPPFLSPSLRTFNVARNILEGKLSHDIGELHDQMRYLDVTHNRLTGSIPNSVSKMTVLDTLAVSQNRLSGTIPSEIGDLRRVLYLYLDGNFLVGMIPPGLAHPNSPMEEMWLQDNMLSGTIPAAFANLPKLVDFFVDGNKFTGTVPSSLCRKELNDDFFEDVPEQDRNYCDSIACPVGHFSESGLFPCEKCEDEYDNPYLGRVGECIDLIDEDILTILYESTSSQGWTETWPEKGDHCNFAGVTCDKDHNVVGLELKGMNLHGTIPEEVGFLKFLKRLDLSDNGLTGFLPSDLRWAPLEQLDISGNELIGVVPPMLCTKPGINGNGDDGDFGCEHIACPVGSYSPTGTGYHRMEGEKCRPCKGGGGKFLASTSCFEGVSSRASERSVGKAGRAVGIFFLVVVLMVVGFFGVKAFKKRKEKNRGPLIGLEFERIEEIS